MTPDSKPKKTWKREVAVALFLWLGYIVETKEPELVTILTFPIFTFAAMAFGLQWYAPNGGVLSGGSLKPFDRGRPQRSREHSSRQDEYPDHWDNNHQRAEDREAPSERRQADLGHQSSEVRQRRDHSGQ